MNETNAVTRREFLRLMASAGTVATLGSVSCRAQRDAMEPVVVENEHIRVEAWILGGRLHERYFARCDGVWIPVAEAEDGGTAGSTAVIAADHSIEAGPLAKIGRNGEELVETFRVEGLRVVRQLKLGGKGPWIHVSTRLDAAQPVELHAFVDRFKFLHQPDWSFAPSMEGFVPDAQYKAPLVLVQSGRITFGIVPDLAELDRLSLQQCNHALDLDVPGGPLLVVGFMPARLAYHSVYMPNEKLTWRAGLSCKNAYYLFLTATGEPGQAYREAVRFHWDIFGRLAQREAAQEQAGTDPSYRDLALWDDWRKKIWEEESPKEWLSVPLPDGSTGGGVLTHRWGSGPAVYLSAWFNTLRTSYGMALYARRKGDAELLGLARQTVDLVLQAPGCDGAFKCIAVPRAPHLPPLWGAGDGCGSSTREGFLGYDMCWTAYWLLKWRATRLPGSEGILDRCRRLARFMVARQMADGMFPTQFADDGSVNEKRSRIVKAETGPVVLFLLELCNQDRDPRYLKAARAGLEFLEKEVIPKRQWYDFETFWSCSPRQPHFDERTGQWPANDLALSQTVEAYLMAFRVTNEQRYLAMGEALLDYLLLYQQCWTNPKLEGLSCPTMLLGGFTTQNSDAEWSDARQSQCGNVLMDYYRATGKVEYLERGVAALRAQFPISPSENWAHEGYGGKAGVSSFHWGTGSGMAGVEIEEDDLRDAIVDVTASRGIGVNGLNLTECRIGDGQIRLEILTPFVWRRQPVVVFRHVVPTRRYRLFVNGAGAGTWSGAELEKGVPVSLGEGKGAR